MSLPWLRLYCETPLDPKLRLVARESGQPIATVLAVWVVMLCHAGSRAGDERGSLAGWVDGLASVVLELPTQVISSVRSAMEGLLIHEGRIIAWHKRQGETSTARVRAWRDRQRETEPQRHGTSETVSLVSETARNAREPTKLHRGEERREEENPSDTGFSASPRLGARGAPQGAPRAEPAGDARPDLLASKAAGPEAATIVKPHRLPPDWRASPALLAFARDRGVDGEAEEEAFIANWRSDATPKARKLSWDDAFRVWVHRASQQRGRGQVARHERRPGYLDGSVFDPPAERTHDGRPIIDGKV